MDDLSVMSDEELDELVKEARKEGLKCKIKKNKSGFEITIKKQ